MVTAGNVHEAHADLTSPLLGLDWTKPGIYSAWGTKGSGKSVLNRLLFRSWDLDAVCVDVNGNADPGPHAEPIEAPLPTRFPDDWRMPGEPAKPRVLHFRAHPSDPRYFEQLGQAVGLALYPQRKRTLLWAGEVDEFHRTAGYPTPHLKTVLRQNRHYNVTALLDGPRPVNVHPLCLAQSDLVAIFHLPQPKDRERIADAIGFPPKLFHEAAHACWRTDHAFLLWDSRARRLYEHEPLPLDAETPA